MHLNLNVECETAIWNLLCAQRQWKQFSMKKCLWSSVRVKYANYSVLKFFRQHNGHATTFVINLTSVSLLWYWDLNTDVRVIYKRQSSFSAIIHTAGAFNYKDKAKGCHRNVFRNAEKYLNSLSYEIIGDTIEKKGISVNLRHESCSWEFSLSWTDIIR